MKYIIYLLGVCIFASGATALATIIRVPDEYPTIKAGIDAAVDGDTVLVAPGTYRGEGNRSIGFYGKAIVVMSEKGPEVTIIDCQGSPGGEENGFFFNSGEDTSSVLQGFTITNGWRKYEAGGILCIGSSPTIRGNIVTGNTAGWGGGIYCSSSSPIIEDNIITNNEAIGYDNGRAGGGGGGIRCALASPIIRRNIIAGNRSVDLGGGIYCRNQSTPFIANNIIEDNWADRLGGGIYCDWSSPHIYRNVIIGNEAYRFEGGGIYCCIGSSVTILNSIFWENIAGGEGDHFYIADSSEVMVTYSDIEGGWEGEGNIDADPLFLLPDKRDYRLLWDSPCIDTGHPDSLDPDGTRSDMGAFYFDQSTPITIYLTPDTTVYHRKENLGVTYTVINIDPDPVTFSLRTDVYLPNGKPYPGNPVVGPKEKTLPGGKTKQQRITHYIPGNTPFGVFTYTTTINSLLSDDILDEDSFRFVIEE